MEVSENTENNLQIDLRVIDCCVITLTIELRKLRTQYATNSLNMSMYMNFPCLCLKCNKPLINRVQTAYFLISILIYATRGNIMKNWIKRLILDIQKFSAHLEECDKKSKKMRSEDRSETYT